MVKKITLEDTIAAVVTPPGEGGVAVIRISGAEALRAAGALFKARSGQAVEQFASHTIHLGEITTQESASGQDAPTVWDQALLSIFKAPHSYTGENIVEISLHGGTVLASKVLELVLRQDVRMAEPGEFTRRAFLNGKLDLAQAEAVLDLIQSKSALSIQTAARQLRGGLSLRFKQIKNGLLKLYAHMEAFLDFPEEDLEVYSDAQMVEGLARACAEIQTLIRTFGRGVLIREGALLVIAGKPNVGKSSLFNALLERDRALVSEHAGTTRDTLEEWLEIKGLAVRIADTAGLMSQSLTALDQMGVERTRQTLMTAQAYLWVVDASQPLEGEDLAAAKNLKSETPILGVLHKSDLGLKSDEAVMRRFFKGTPVQNAAAWISVSSKTGHGFEALEEIVYQTLCGQHAEAGGEQITRIRHKLALEAALEALTRAKKAFEERASLELVTLDLKAAIDALRELIGEVYSEDLLDVIFAEFCIGK